MKALISARVLSSAQASPSPKPFEIWDRDLCGFVLRVQPSGAKSYIVQVSRGRRVTIGRLARCFDKWKHKSLREISTEVVEDWKVARLADGLAPATVLRDVAALSGVLSRAVKMGRLEGNPVRNVDKPRVDRRPKVRYLDTDEESRLRTALTKRDEKGLAARKSANEWRRARKRELLPMPKRFWDHLTPAVSLSMNTGLRRGELLGLLWTDIDLQQKLLTVRGTSAKSGDTRYVPLNDEAVSLLKDWGKDSLKADRVFPVTTSFKTAWAALLISAKITRFRWHDLRHHFASRLVQAGVPLNTVRELLGHGSLAMTLRYANLAPNQTRDAVAKLLQAPVVA